MTDTTTAAPAATQLAPYLFFYGRCEEALEFYKAALGGSYELQRFEGSPLTDEIPPGFENKVMHSSFTAPGIAFFAGDGMEIKAVDPEAGNISLALTARDRAEGERYFKALSNGGVVKQPLDDAFWGGRFGVCVDRFGTEWLLTSP